MSNNTMKELRTLRRTIVKIKDMSLEMRGRLERLNPLDFPVGKKLQLDAYNAYLYIYAVHSTLSCLHKEIDEEIQKIEEAE